MTSEIDGWKVDVYEGTSEPVTFMDSLKDMYRHVQCDCVDIITRFIEGVPFCFICDDCGLLKTSPRVSAVDVEGEVALVGNLLVTAPSDEGGMRSLTDAEKTILRRHSELYLVQDRDSDARYNVECLTGLMYRASEDAGVIGRI